MTNFEHMDKDDLAEALAEESNCQYCAYQCKPECDDISDDDIRPCVEGIRKWFDEESPYDD